MTFRPFKVIQGNDFGTNRKYACNFLLARHRNLGPLLHRFGYIAGFTVLMTPPLFLPNFGGVSIQLDRPRWGQREQVL